MHAYVVFSRLWCILCYSFQSEYNVNNYNYIANKIHDIFDECAPMVKLVEAYASKAVYAPSIVPHHLSIVPLLSSQISRPRLCPATLRTLTTQLCLCAGFWKLTIGITASIYGVRNCVIILSQNCETFILNVHKSSWCETKIIINDHFDLERCRHIYCCY